VTGGLFGASGDRGVIFFDVKDGRAVVTYSDGRTYLLDLNWLAAMGGDQAALPSDELMRLACTGPLATGLWNVASLAPYLGDQVPQACR
jgi:hypothetical protein